MVSTLCLVAPGAKPWPKYATPGDTSCACFSQQGRQLVWCRAWGASRTAQGNSWTKAVMGWLHRQGSTRGLWQHWERWLGQGWASTGRWMPKESSSGMCEIEHQQIQLQGVLAWEEQDRRASGKKPWGGRAPSRRKLGRSGRAHERKTSKRVKQALTFIDSLQFHVPPDNRPPQATGHHPGRGGCLRSRTPYLQCPSSLVMAVRRHPSLY